MDQRPMSSPRRWCGSTFKPCQCKYLATHSNAQQDPGQARSQSPCYDSASNRSLSGQYWPKQILKQNSLGQRESTNLYDDQLLQSNGQKRQLTPHWLTEAFRQPGPYIDPSLLYAPIESGSGSMPNFDTRPNPTTTGQPESSLLNGQRAPGQYGVSTSGFDASSSSQRRSTSFLDPFSSSGQPGSTRFVNNGAHESRKGCNCKKSKCLKLYCDCFAGSKYCTNLCSCEHCFNKVNHETIVVATRTMIEAKNPLAFASKVVIGASSGQASSPPYIDAGVESADAVSFGRHKSGCKCYKSGCIKRYCECYATGVGCSVKCRCYDCENIFGRKDK